jgi:hypothetical protein
METHRLEFSASVVEIFLEAQQVEQVWMELTQASSVAGDSFLQV